MADNSRRADGYIIISTELDSEGFKKGSKELESATESLTKQVETFGNKIDTSFDKLNTSSAGAKKSVDSVKVSLGEATKEAKKLIQTEGKTGTTPTGSAEWEKTKTKIQSAEVEALNYKNKLNQINNTEVKAPKFSVAQETPELKVSTKSAETSVDRLQQKIKGLIQEEKKASNTPVGSTEWDKTKTKIQGAETEAQNYKNKLNQINSTEVKAPKYTVAQETPELKVSTEQAEASAEGLKGKLVSAAKSAQNAWEGFCNKLKSGIGASANSSEASIEKLKAKIAEAEKVAWNDYNKVTIDVDVKDKSTASLKNNLSSIKTQLQQASEKAKEMGVSLNGSMQSAKTATKGYATEIRNANAQENAFEGSVSTINASGIKALDYEMKQLVADVKAATQAAKVGFAGDSAGAKNFSVTIQSLEAETMRLQAKLNAIGNAQAPNMQYERFKNNITAAQTRLAQLKQQESFFHGTGADRTSERYKKLQSEIKETEWELKQYQGAESQSFKTTATAAKYNATLKQVRRSLQRLKTEEKQENRQEKKSKKETRKNTKEYKKLQKTFRKLSSAMRRVRMNSMFLKNGFRTLKSAGKNLKKTMEQLSDSIKEVESAMTFGMSNLPIVLSDTFTDIASAVSNGLQSLGGTLTNMFGSITDSLSEVTSGFNLSAQGGNNLADSLKNTISQALKACVSIRSLYMLVRKLKNVTVESFQTLVQYDDDANAAISEMYSSLLQLKYSLATAFTPIVEVVAPYISTFIDMITDATNAIGQFFAALTGQTTYTQVADVSADYAASLSDTSDSASDASDSVDDTTESVEDLEEAENQLAGFDELNILEDTSSDDIDTDTDTDTSTDSGSSSSSGDGITVTYEEVDIAEEISDFVNRIKEAWAEEDFTEIGEIIAEKINEAFEKVYDLINWDNVGDTITYYVEAFCEIFNSLVDNIDWELIGATFGAGINTIINTVNLLLTEIDWENLGSSIADCFNGLIYEIEWDNIGDCFGNLFAAIVGYYEGFMLEFDFDALGEGITDALNSALSNINNTIETTDWTGMVSNLVSGLNTAVDNFKWGTLGTTIGNAIGAGIEMAGTFLTEFEFDDLFGGIATTLNNIMVEIDEAVDNVEWIKIGENFADGFNSALDTIDAKQWGDTINNLIMSLLDMGLTFFKEADWEKYIVNLSEFLDALDTQEIKDSLKELIYDALSVGLLTGLELFDATFPKISKILGIHTYLNQIEEYCEEVVAEENGEETSLDEAVEDEYLQSGSYLLNLEFDSETFSEKWEDWRDEHPFWDMIISGMEEEGELEGEADTNIVHNFKTGTLSEKWDNFLDKHPFIASMVEELENATTAAKNGELWQYFKTSLSDSWDTFLDNHPFIASIVDKLENATTAAKEGTLKQLFTTSLSDKWDTFLDNHPFIANIVDNLTGGGDGEEEGGLKLNVLKGDNDGETWWDTFLDNHPFIAKIVDKIAGGEDGTEEGGLLMNLFKGSWNDDAEDALDTSDGSTKTSTLTQALSKLTSKWNSDADTALTAKSSRSSTLTQKLSKGSWSTTANNALTAKSSRTSTLKQYLKKGSGSNWNSDASYVVKNAKDKTVKYTVNIASKLASSFKTLLGLASGGLIINGEVRTFAKGGALTKTGTITWDNIPKYGSGTSNAHGTLFVAGEAGPEIVGHVGGRTEVLNKSQLADTMYTAVVNGIGDAVNAFWGALANKLAECSNAIIGSMEYLATNEGTISAVSIVTSGGESTDLISALESIVNTNYVVPDMATGTITPYSTNVASVSTSDVEATLTGNNEELISVVEQSVTNATESIVSAIMNYSGTDVTIDSNSLTSSVVKEINKRTRMSGRSPILGVG